MYDIEIYETKNGKNEIQKAKRYLEDYKMRSDSNE